MQNEMRVRPSLVRQPEQLQAARRALGLSAEGLARMVRVESGRTVRRWEAGEREIPGPVTVLMEIAMDFLRQKNDILRQLELLQSGQMHSQMSWGSKMVDDTANNISRLLEAKKSLEDALITLTRQEPSDAVSNKVHWYTLKRMTPMPDPSQEDDWTMPGELSPEAALAYFAKNKEFNCHLEVCEDDDLGAEFILEKRIRVLSPSAASQSVRSGELVESFYVRRGGTL
jgi:transcriptional regulator with XRE-family HTH domain